MSKTTRRYTVWDSAEEAALRAGVKKHGLGSWEIIRTDSEFSVLRGRSGVQLKDKWRNLVKFHHITAEEAKYAQSRLNSAGDWRKKAEDVRCGGRNVIDKQYLKSIAVAHATRGGRSPRKLVIKPGSQQTLRGRSAGKQRSGSLWSPGGTDSSLNSGDEDYDHDDDQDEEATCIIACCCGVDYDDGQMMVECMLCSTWSHVDCLQNRTNLQPDKYYYDLDNYVCDHCQSDLGNHHRDGTAPPINLQGRNNRRSSDGDLCSQRTHHTDQRSLGLEVDQVGKQSRTAAWIQQTTMVRLNVQGANSDGVGVNSHHTDDSMDWDVEDLQGVVRRARATNCRKRRRTSWCEGFLEGSDIVTPSAGSPHAGSPSKKPIKVYSPSKLPPASSRLVKMARLSDEATGPAPPLQSSWPSHPTLTQALSPHASLPIQHKQEPGVELATARLAPPAARKPPLPVGAPRIGQYVPNREDLRLVAGRGHSGASRSSSTLQSPPHSLLCSPPGYLMPTGIPMLVQAPGGSRVSGDGSVVRKDSESEAEVDEALVVTQRPRANSDGLRSEGVLLAHQQLNMMMTAESGVSAPLSIGGSSGTNVSLGQAGGDLTLLPGVSWSEADFHMLLNSPNMQNAGVQGLPLPSSGWPPGLQVQPPGLPRTSSGWTSLTSPSGIGSLASPDLLARCVLPSPVELHTRSPLPQAADSHPDGQGALANAGMPASTGMPAMGPPIGATTPAIASVIPPMSAGMPPRSLGIPAVGAGGQTLGRGFQGPPPTSSGAGEMLPPTQPAVQQGRVHLQGMQSAAAQWMLQQQLLQVIGMDAMHPSGGVDMRAFPRFHRRSSESGDGGTLSFLNLDGIDGMAEGRS